MRNIALMEMGARLSQASSHHCDFPASSIIDNSLTKPWISTGLFPQFFVISFPDLMQIQSIKIVASQVKDVIVERSTTERVANYEEVTEKMLPKTTEKRVEQVISNEEVTAQHLKFTIKSGYQPFVGVHSVEIMGSLASGRSPSVLRKATSARPRTNEESDELLEESELHKKKRFQSAFKVPTSNRPSQDHTAANDASIWDGGSSSMWQDDYIYDDNADNDDDSEEDEY